MKIISNNQIEEFSWFRKKECFAVILISIFGIALYFNSITNGFVWDDEDQIVKNLTLQSLSNIGNFWTGSTFYAGGSENFLGLYYRPVTTTFFSLLVSLFGPIPIPFHAASVLFHTFNAILVFLLFKRFFSHGLALLLALLFLSHPMHTEVVDYASGLGDLISFSLGLSGLLLFTESQTIARKKFIFAIVLFSLSLLAKETGLLLLVGAFMYRVLYYKQLVRSFASLSASALIYLFLRIVFSNIQSHIQNFVPIMSATLFEKIITAPKIVAYYINQFFFPSNLAISQHWVVRSVSFQDFYFPLIEITALISAVTALYCFVIRKHGGDREKSFFIGIALLTSGIAAHLHMVPLFGTVADRWFYVPSVGLIIIIGTMLSLIKERLHPRIVGIATLCIVLIIAILAMHTFVRNSDWKDGYALYSHDIRINPHSYELENNLGQEFYKKGDLDQAKRHFENSISLTSDNWFALNNLATVYFRQDDIPNARRIYQQVVDNSDLYLAYENLARILILHDTPIAAKEFTEQSLNKFPENPRLWGILAIAHSRLGNKKAALQAAQKAYELRPDELNSVIYQKLKQGLAI